MGSRRLPAPWVFEEPPRASSLVSLVRMIRETCDEAEKQGRGWRVVIDGLRPHTQRLWQELPLPERARFLRHLRPWWDAHRHRTAPQIMERIHQAREHAPAHTKGEVGAEAGLDLAGQCHGRLSVARLHKLGADQRGALDRSGGALIAGTQWCSQKRERDCGTHGPRNGHCRRTGNDVVHGRLL